MFTAIYNLFLSFLCVQYKKIDVESSLICLCLSKIAYYEIESKHAIYDGIVTHFRNNVINYYQDIGYMWRIDDIVYVAFKGTNDVSDVIIDINCFIMENIHAGFHKVFYEVENELTTDLNTQKNKCHIHKIVFTGHSLGGAIATIAGHFYAEKFPDCMVEVVTFGSPKVGNSEFVKEFNKRVYTCLRLFNSEDPIPLVPCDLTYKHVDGGVCLYGPFSLMDHGCFNYARNLLEYSHHLNGKV
jgi:hypothetical protein